MNTEEKELLLKEYSNRLPYRLKFKYFDPYDKENDRVCTVNEVDVMANCFCDKTGARYRFSRNSMPILFPIECLTKPITIASVNEGKTFVPMDPIKFFAWENKLALDNNLVEYGSIDVNRIQNWIIELMQKWHINYRLPAHLFVPVTETFNPYAK